eukprot:10855184-Heterocapsa_arctica.AAC.1
MQLLTVKEGLFVDKRQGVRPELSNSLVTELSLSQSRPFEPEIFNSFGPSYRIVIGPLDQESRVRNPE